MLAPGRSTSWPSPGASSSALSAAADTDVPTSWIEIAPWESTSRWRSARTTPSTDSRASFGKDDVSGRALRLAAKDRERRQTKGVAQDVEDLLGVYGGHGYPQVLQGRRPSR